MLSDVTFSYAGQSISVPGLYLLIGILIVLGLAGFIVAIASARRIERKTNEANDILVVQLERIGDALDRLVTQNSQASANAARPASEPVRASNRPLAEWTVPGRSVPPPARVIPEGSSLERAAQKPAPALSPEHVQPAPVAQASVQTAAQGTMQASTQPEKSPENQPVESTLSEPARSILFSMLGR